MSEIPETEYLPEGISELTIDWLQLVYSNLNWNQLQKIHIHESPHMNLLCLDDLLSFYPPKQGTPLMTDLPYCIHRIPPDYRTGQSEGDWTLVPEYYIDLMKAYRLLRLPRRPTRPSFDQMGIETAQLWARRSADSKLKVGVAILSDVSHTLVSIGYNGRFPGSKTEDRASDTQGGSECLHGEQNAIVRAKWEYGEGHTLYSTAEPCHECALLILAARHIRRVVYLTPYAGDGKRRRGSEILKEAGLEVIAWE